MSEVQIKQRVQGMPAEDGAGVKLSRIINQPGYKQQDPFLLLDEFKSDDPNDYIAGFPPHPHRGFCTLTYMLAGRMGHEDSQGNKGEIDAGGLQWMKAARGIIHSEMPKQDNGLMWGFQLWINLPALEKMGEPEYADIPGRDVPVVEKAAGQVRVLAGSYQEIKGPVSVPQRDFLYLDLKLNDEKAMEVPGQGQQTRLAYLYQGEVSIAGETVRAGELIELSAEGTLVIKARSQAGMLVLAANPIGEPVAQYGPFVMNTQEELKQAFADYQNGRFA